jgi:hypothetical protein
MVDLPLPDEGPPGASPAAVSGDEALRRVVARVQAWQHRDPLARRIAPKDVVGVGVVALPYAGGAAPGARADELEPLFHQPRLLPGLSHQALVGFAARHAVAEPPGAPDWPRREIDRADASTEPAPQTRYLLTAAVSDSRSHAVSPRRLLLAPLGTAIWGRRELSRARVALAATAALSMVVALAAGWLEGRTPPAERATASDMAANVEPAASAEARPAVVAAAASTPAPITASAAGTAGVASQAASAVPMPRRPSEPGATVPERATAVAPFEPHYALVSAPAKKRAAAEATLQQVQRLLGPALGTMQAQILPSPEGYVVTIWPLPTQVDAERLAEVLARRGVPMKWMEF